MIKWYHSYIERQSDKHEYNPLVIAGHATQPAAPLAARHYQIIGRYCMDIVQENTCMNSFGAV